MSTELPLNVVVPVFTIEMFPFEPLIKFDDSPK